MTEKEGLGLSQLRPVEEVVGEMVRGPHDLRFFPDEPAWAFSVGDETERMYLGECVSTQDAETDRDCLVGILTRLIERERAAAYAAGKSDGAREERARVESDAAAMRARTVAIFDGILGSGWQSKPEPSIEDLDPEIIDALFRDDDHPG